MEVSLYRTTVPVAVLILVLCGAEALGYLAFPRMGRSQSQSETAEGVANCCGLGLKSEFVTGENGREELEVCTARAGCCDGLREVVDQSPEGFSYSMCVPGLFFHSESKANTAESVGKFKVLMRMMMGRHQRGEQQK